MVGSMLKEMVATPANLLQQRKDSAKRTEILKCLRCSSTVSLWRLRELALTSGGLLDDNLRMLAWPKLLGVRRIDCNDSDYFNLYSAYNAALNESGDAGVSKFYSRTKCNVDRKMIEQVKRDVSRSLWHLKPSESKRSAAKTKKKQSAVGGCILKVLDEEPDLNYYQGFHDVVSIFLITLQSPHLTTSCLLRTTTHHFGPSMSPSFAPLTTSINLALFPLLSLLSPPLLSHLLLSTVEPYFLISW
eukprot:CAMPEP_0182513232 /NCGR_PEP_ID=MMETSP1321-20130603/33630_1 /TAXON_ID=91990 /ORGANISM="Bolidomonas sp., Strain RCC1657" /LENGTH=244 /DNA_ID=CAMNT_0024720211 /DNA_START=74 /DNA_END=805 /DNA_ORIENTATION=+